MILFVRDNFVVVHFFVFSGQEPVAPKVNFYPPIYLEKNCFNFIISYIPVYKKICFKINLLIKKDPGFYCNSFIVNLKYFTSKCYSFTLEMNILLSRNIRIIFGRKNPMQCFY